jgi:hypothetical protein
MTDSLRELQTRFLAILPRIRRHAAVYFRDVRCPGRQADAVAETVALAWQSYLDLARRGRDAGRFASALAAFAARNVRCGRWLCGAERPRDALSARAQRLHGFTLSPLSDFDTGSGEGYGAALADGSVTPVPDAVQLRLDFAAWRRRWGARDRRLINGLARGERVAALARQLGLTRARLYQLRQAYAADWAQFYGEAPPACTAAPESIRAV